MKKLVLALLISALAVSGATTVSAAPGKGSWGDVPKTSDKLVLDGKLDEVYKQGLKVDISTLRESDKPDTASGTGYYVWDGDYIWAFIEISDSDLYPTEEKKTAQKYWECDGVEVYYDFDNNGTTYHKWVCLYDDFVNKFTDAENVTESETKAVKNDTGYTIELKTKVPSNIKDGSLVGVNLIINNITTVGRVIVRAPQSDGANETEVAKFDTVTLSDKAVTANKAATTAAQTADPITLAALSIAAAAAGAVALKKRSK